MSKWRNPFLDSALSVVKGAVCCVTGLPVGRSTKSVKFSVRLSFIDAAQHV